MKRLVTACLAVGVVIWLGIGLVWADAPGEPAGIVIATERSFAESLAAKEIRRYVYVRTGTLLPMVTDIEDVEAAVDGWLIVVGCKEQSLVREFAAGDELKAMVAALKPEQYVLKTISHRSRRVVLVVGGDPIGTLYAAYRLAEHLGVRFYLHGDVVPDKPIVLRIPCVDEVGKPLFDRRGILPFHDFPEGPDWWSADGYKAILGQLPKMRMNFIGMHTYGPTGAGPEPLTWYGVPEDVSADGTVRASYLSHHFTTNPGDKGFWGYHPKRTSEYTFGATAMYDRDNYGADYMRGTHPWSKMSPEQCNRLFNQVGCMLGDALGFARRLGVKTCIGTEAPLRIPPAVKARLTAAGKSPDDPAVVQEVYEGMFRRIMKTHEKLDIFARADKDAALDVSFDGVVVEDGSLLIEFVQRVGSPCIAGIELHCATSRAKINCGGPAFGAYGDDLVRRDPQELYYKRQRPGRTPASGDFYRDWARVLFGPEAAGEIAAIFAKVDCRLPRPSAWAGGPGGIKPDRRPWQQAVKAYRFVDELAHLRSRIRGKGNLQRFDYWLESFRYLRAVGRLNSTWPG